MQPFAFCAHRHEIRDASSARLRLLGVLDPPQNRISVRAVEILEEGLRTGGSGESCCQVIRDSGGSSAVVGPLPSAVDSCLFHLGKARGLQPTRLEQSLGLLAVDSRPGASVISRTKPLKPTIFVKCSFLTVDPSPGERSLDRRGVGQGMARVALRDVQPDAGEVGVVDLQPVPTKPLRSGPSELVLARARPKMASSLSQLTWLHVKAWGILFQPTFGVQGRSSPMDRRFRTARS